MNSAVGYGELAHRAVVDIANDFHFRATTNDGRHIQVPMGYQIEEVGFRPYRAGKASPEELQAELDHTIQKAADEGVDLGIEGEESIRKLAIQKGWGIDCSNFAYRALMLIHDRMDLNPYARTVYRASKDIQAFHADPEKTSWSPKDANGNPRDLTAAEREKLDSLDQIDIEWIARVFGKDPEFITGSAHICSDVATATIQPYEIIPGDLIAFRKAGAEVVSHLGLIEQVEMNGEAVRADFWHAWHSRDFQSGVRRDSVTIEPGTAAWSHEGLEDPSRYAGYELRRPLALANAYAALTAGA